jgi:hypothetical protein
MPDIDETVRLIQQHIEDTRKAHVPHPNYAPESVCTACYASWPCPSLLMINHYEDIMGVVAYMRDPVLYFARKMESRLRENDDKGGWRIETPEFDSLRHFTRSIDNHLYDLREISGVWPFTEKALDAMIRRSTHIANFAMMIADNALHWKELLKSGSATARVEGDTDAPE